jgi:hypothetical protein
MKKIIIAALLLASVGFSTIGCCNKENSMTQTATEPFEHLIRFRNGQASGIDRVDFYRDTQTNIVYIQVRDYNSNATTAGFAPYLNSEGNPMNYDEWKKLYNVD